MINLAVSRFLLRGAGCLIEVMCIRGKEIWKTFAFDLSPKLKMFEILIIVVK